MTRAELRPGAPRRRPVIAALCLGAGLLLLAAAIGFGHFSRTWASSSALPVVNLRWDASTPGFASWLAVVLGTLVLVAAVVAIAVGGRSWIVLAVVAGFAAPPFALSALPGNYAAITDDYLSSQRVPTAYLAWWFGLLGLLLVAGGALGYLGRGRAIRPGALLGGGAAGLIAVLAAAVLVLPDADPGRGFEATTTAAGGPAPPVPTDVGRVPAFTVRVDGIGEDAVRAAGAGFVVRTPDGVRAFDASGQQRWAHRHRDWAATYLGVYDDGGTVVVRFDSGAHQAGVLVGLDAETGTLLWRTDDRVQVAAVTDTPGDTPTDGQGHYLVTFSGPNMTRIDTRTGRELWRTDIGYPNSHLVASTGADIGLFSGQVQQQDVAMHYLAVDPATGAIRHNIAVGRYPRWEGGGVSAAAAGRDGLVFAGGDGQPRYLNVATGRVFPLPPGALARGGGPDGFVTETPIFGGRTLGLHDGVDGRLRCSVDVQGTGGVTVAGLGSMLLIGTRDGVRAYRATDSGACAPLPGADLHVPADDLVVAPGALLVVDRKEGTITGYA